MTANFLELFLLAFVVIAIGYSGLASCTTLLYRRKSWGQLRPNELKVKQGSASIENRLDLFMRTFFTCVFTYQIYLLALVLGGLAYLVLTYIVR